jgi:hypothetical protein
MPDLIPGGRDETVAGQNRFQDVPPGHVWRKISPKVFTSVSLSGAKVVGHAQLGGGEASGSESATARRGARRAGEGDSNFKYLWLALHGANHAEKLNGLARFRRAALTSYECCEYENMNPSLLPGDEALREIIDTSYQETNRGLMDKSETSGDPSPEQ